MACKSLSLLKLSFGTTTIGVGLNMKDRIAKVKVTRFGCFQSVC